MNRIVRDGFPIERLPKEVRDSLPAWARIRLEIEISPEEGERLDMLVAGSIPNVHGDEQTTLAHLRALRDED